jgi:hypothetical protein
MSGPPLPALVPMLARVGGRKPLAGDPEP